ncbi:hypothetical protein MCUN1_001197 [Malassezia cuniculi]|uniref:Uncharacterized protein n=1 Tax=Malassezia cuniculi TaxID=948313 RepID=A0AAF0EXB7_9BASI|nr:hypothetical protein MCUN1_001197 [Malassezia cuniculi]
MWTRATVALRMARGARVMPRSTLAPGVSRAACVSSVRMLRTSAWAAASEDNRSDMMSSTLPPGFEKLGESPEALAAINQLMDTLEKQGIDLSSGQKPSMTQLYKLATNQEVRDAASRVVNEMKKPNGLRLARPVASIYPGSKVQNASPSGFRAEIGPIHDSRWGLGLMDIRDVHRESLAHFCTLPSNTAYTADELELVLAQAAAGQFMPPIKMVLEPPPMFPIDTPTRIANPSTKLFIDNLTYCTAVAFAFYLVAAIGYALFVPRRYRTEPELPRILAASGHKRKLASPQEILARLRNLVPQLVHRVRTLNPMRTGVSQYLPTNTKGHLSA